MSQRYYFIFTPETFPLFFAIINTAIKTISKDGIDYISITDIARQKNATDPNGVIANWMRNRNTVEFLGIWETLHFLLVFQQKIFRIVCRFKKMHYLCNDKSRPLPIRTAYPAGHFLYTLIPQHFSLTIFISFWATKYCPGFYHVRFFTYLSAANQDKQNHQ